LWIVFCLGGSRVDGALVCCNDDGNRLAERGVESSHVNPAYRTKIDDSVVSIGKTLLQQVMEANMETLQEKLEAYHRHKAECQLLGREFQFAKGNSKALPAQYSFRIDPSDNTRQRANVHHAGR
jgi:hypothetical protein